METKLLVSTFMQLISCIFCNSGFTSMLLFFKVLQRKLKLVYQTLFILYECWGLIKLLHQFHSKLIITFIFKLYLFSCFSRLSMVWLISSKLFLVTIFYAPLPIFCWASISFLLFFSTIFFFSVELFYLC